MMADLERHVLAHWSALCPAQRVPRRVRTVVLSSSREPHGGRIVLIFKDNEDKPSLIGKVPRHPDGAARLEEEWRLLRLVYRGLSSGPKLTLPEPKEKLTLHGVPVYLQQALGGHNLKTLIQRGQWRVTRRQVSADLNRVDRWLDQLQALRPPVVDGGLHSLQQLPTLLEQVKQALPELLSRGLISGLQAQALLERAASLGLVLATQEPCWVHGDLWPGNILVDRFRWHVIDWEGLCVGERYFDRVWYALHHGMVCEAYLEGSEDLGVGLRRLLFRSDPVSEAVSKHLQGLFPRGSVTHRELLTLVLVALAGRQLLGLGRRSALERDAPLLLQEWLAHPERVRL